MKTRLIITLVATALATFVTPALAQDEEKSGGGIFGGSPLHWTIEPILDKYVEHITRYYNLNEDQEAFTKQLLNKRVKSFLTEHEREARVLFAELWYYQRKRELPSPDAAKQWAARGGPLMAAIEKEVVEGNMLWREILDEKQREMHDKDLEVMHQQFALFRDRMERWKNGDVKEEDIFGRNSNITQSRVDRRPEDQWELRVRYFIQAFNLDEGQQETAWSIHRELVDKAGRYREQNKERFERIEKEFAKLAQSQPQRDKEALRQAHERRRELQRELAELDKPIQEEMFTELMTRLDKIPTADQRKHRDKYEQNLKRNIEQREAVVAGSTSQPAAETQPAATTTAPAAVSEAPVTVDSN